MLKLEDLKVGMKIDIRDLNYVGDKVILVGDFTRRYYGSILYIGDNCTDELYSLCSSIIAEGKSYYKHIGILDEVDYDE